MHSKKPKFQISDGIETLRDVGTPVVDTMRTETNASIDALWKQLLGAEKPAEHPTHGDLTEGQSIVFTQIFGSKKTEQSTHEAPKPAEKPRNVNIAAGIDYRSEIIHGEKRISKETEQILSQQIEQIVIELRQLVNSSQALATEFKDVAVDQHITKPGKYHVNLFQFILTLVRQSRQKIEHSGSWLAAAKGKKGKQGYWDMFAQQGTSFAQNNERAIATQAG